MNREQAKQMFRDDKDAYGKPKAVMSKIDKIYDEFEQENGVTKYVNVHIGDMIEWQGHFFVENSHDDPIQFLTGVNQITNIFIEDNLLLMKLDNNKQFIMANFRSNYSNEELTKLLSGWKKV
jgi:hypothetical protein